MVTVLDIVDWKILEVLDIVDWKILEVLGEEMVPVLDIGARMKILEVHGKAHGRRQVVRKVLGV